MAERAVPTRAGDPASWAIGPYGEQGFSSASNGYNGTRPENAGIWDRANVAVYGDVDVHGVDNEWSLGAAVRIEDFYDSFGTTMNSKLSGRYAFTDAFAVRAGVSSGFRAPTPGQQNVLNVTTEFDYEIGDLINNGTIPSTSLSRRCGTARRCSRNRRSTTPSERWSTAALSRSRRTTSAST